MIRHFATFLAIAGFATISSMAQTTTTTAAVTRVTALPPLGLGSTETARISLTNIATASQAGTAASCDGSVSFYNAAGTLIGAATTFKIASGVTSVVSLPFASAGLTGPRGVIRGAVSVTRAASTTTTPAAPCSLLLAMETFETVSGATHMYLTEQVATAGGFGGGR